MVFEENEEDGSDLAFGQLRQDARDNANIVSSFWDACTPPLAGGQVIHTANEDTESYWSFTLRLHILCSAVMGW